MQKEKQLVPKLRFPAFNDVWFVKRYNEIYTFYTTNSFSRNDLNYNGGIVKNIHYGDIHTKYSTQFDILNEEVPYINISIDLSRIKNENYCKEGDLLVADASEDYADIGKTIEICNLNNENLLSGLHTFLARPNKFDVAIGFTSYLLQSRYVRKQIMKIAQGTKVLGLSTTRLGKVTLILPSSTQEQQKIADFLSAIDRRIQNLEKKKELLEQYKKGITQKIFKQEIRFKDDNGKAFPEWKRKKLGDFLVERNTKKPKSKEYPLMSFVAHKGVTPKGDRYNREFLVSNTNSKKYKITEYGDFIYSSNNLETGSIGLNLYGSACISPVYSIFRMNKSSDYRFMNSYLKRKKFINKMIRFRQGVVYGQWRIHESDFLKIEDKFPCLKEQKKIADFLSAIDQRINLVTQQITQTKTYKKGLLQQMFV